MPAKTVTVTLSNGAITINPWVVAISTTKEDFVSWEGQGCRVKIDLVHPQHLSLVPSSCYAPRVTGTPTDDAHPGTYHYVVSVLGPDDDQRVARAYTIDPDYKVDR
ncbi:MAG: hypothetical protein H6Q05_4683 [Acidobacteria bacterium]|nr:hypothetical protein [Acidobacteriota bacterium]